MLLAKILSIFILFDADKNFKEYICKNGGIPRVINCLSSKREETVLSAVTTLMFLVYPESKAGLYILFYVV